MASSLDLITEPGMREFRANADFLQRGRLRDDQNRRAQGYYGGYMEDRTQARGLDTAVRRALGPDVPIAGPGGDAAVGGTIPADGNIDAMPGTDAARELGMASPTGSSLGTVMAGPSRQDRLMRAFTSTPGGGANAMRMAGQQDSRINDLGEKALQAYAKGQVEIGDHYAQQAGKSVPDAIRLNAQTAAQTLEAGNMAKTYGYGDHDPAQLHKFIQAFFTNGRNPQRAAAAAGPSRPARPDQQELTDVRVDLARAQAEALRREPQPRRTETQEDVDRARAEALRRDPGPRRTPQQEAMEIERVARENVKARMAGSTYSPQAFEAQVAQELQRLRTMLGAGAASQDPQAPMPPDAPQAPMPVPRTAIPDRYGAGQRQPGAGGRALGGVSPPQPGEMEALPAPEPVPQQGNPPPQDAPRDPAQRQQGMTYRSPTTGALAVWTGSGWAPVR